LKRCEDSEENLDQELLKIHEDIRWLKQKIKDSDDDNKKVEVDLSDGCYVVCHNTFLAKCVSTEKMEKGR